MHILSLFVLLVLIISCGKREVSSETHPPAVLNLTDLPTSTLSRPLQHAESSFAEIVISGDKTELFLQDKPIATSPSAEELFSEIRRVRKDNDKLGKRTPLLISASASTPFDTIRDRIRIAAKAGI